MPPTFDTRHANEVDQPLGDQRQPFVRIDEQLAHGLRRRALLAHQPKAGDLLGRKRVFEEEQAVWFEQLGQRHRVMWMQVLVHVVGELEAKAKLVAKVGEHLGNVFEVGFVVEGAGCGQAFFGAPALSARRNPPPPYWPSWQRMTE